MTQPRPGYLTAERARMLGAFLEEITSASIRTRWAFKSTIVINDSGGDEVIVVVRWDESIPAYVAEIR